MSRKLISPLGGSGITSYPQRSDSPWELLKRHLAGSLHRINFSPHWLCLAPASPIIFASMQPTWQLCYLKADRDCVLFIIDVSSVTELGNRHRLGSRLISAAPLYLLALSFHTLVWRLGARNGNKKWSSGIRVSSLEDSGAPGCGWSSC